MPNGLDMQAWSATKPKDRTILCVGRALRHKGHLEAMAAIARALRSRPEWSARFMVSDPVAADQEPETVQALRDAAEDFNGRIRVDSNVPYAEVKTAWESAAVGMVLTTGPEPFGRTALEALASGAALITSGRGGLAEICGPCAVTVDPGDADRPRGGARPASGCARTARRACARRPRAGRAAVRHPRPSRGRWTISSPPASPGDIARRSKCLAFRPRRRKGCPGDVEPHGLEISKRLPAIRPESRAAGRGSGA